MNKEKIVGQIAKCFDLHSIKYDLVQLNKYVDKWYKNKKSLISILRKHPNWNEDAMAILFDYDYEREMDHSLFSNTLIKITQEYLKDLVGKRIKIFSLNEVNQTVTIPLNGEFYFHGRWYAEDTREVFDKEAIVLDYCEDTDAFKVSTGGFLGWIPMCFSIAHKINEGLGFIFRECCCQSVENHKVENIKTYLVDCVEGQKMSRVLNKYFSKVGINELENYNSLFAKLADSINPLKITRHTLLSVHPCDYLHMSYGDNWDSCHRLDGGSYAAGTLSYMLDGTSMILYTVSNSYNGNEFWAEKRINRQVFCYGNNALLQSRLYPDYSDIKNNDNFRAIVQQIFAVCLEKDNLWTIKDYTSTINNYIATNTRSKHYRDYEHSKFHPMTSLLRGEEHGKIKIGCNSPCIKCGKLFKNQDGTRQLLCDYCRGLQCECCQRTWSGLLREIDGKYYCSDCYHQCEDCGKYTLEKLNIINPDLSSEMKVCNDCIADKEKYIQCETCGEYTYNNLHIKEIYGKHLCYKCRISGNVVDMPPNSEYYGAVDQRNGR